MLSIPGGSDCSPAAGLTAGSRGVGTLAWQGGAGGGLGRQGQREALLASPPQPWSTGAAAHSALGPRRLLTGDDAIEKRPLEQRWDTSTQAAFGLCGQRLGFSVEILCDLLSCQDDRTFFHLLWLLRRQHRTPEIGSPWSQTPGAAGDPQPCWLPAELGVVPSTRAGVQGTDRGHRGSTAGEAAQSSPGRGVKPPGDTFPTILRPFPRRVGLQGFL